MMTLGANMTKLNDIFTIESAARDHLIQPWDEIGKLGKEIRPLITSAENIYLIDANGKKLIDAPAGMWCSQVGYGRKEIAQAMSDQAMLLSYNSPWYTTNSPAALLSKKIAEFTPGDLNHVFFTSGGSTAVDSALRLVQFYQHARGKPEKKTILARYGGYHGSTHLSAACSGDPTSKSKFNLEHEPVSFLTSPNPSQLPEGISLNKFCDFLLQEMADRIKQIGAENISVFIAEPVQASGGVNISPEGYLKGAIKICRENDILYISDEVVTGFGRCGSWFASEEVFGITPDIITFAKGITSGYIPLGGYAVSNKLLDEIAENSGDDSTFANGYTYSGHPVSCAVGLANIKIIEDENILQHVREITPYFSEKLHELSEMPLVKEVRTIGMLAAVECHSREETAEKLGLIIDKHCVELGMIVRPIGNICVMSPPLIITKGQIDDMVEILREGITRASKEIL